MPQMGEVLISKIKELSEICEDLSHKTQKAKST